MTSRELALVEGGAKPPNPCNEGVLKATPMRPGTRFGQIGNARRATQTQLAVHRALDMQVLGSSPGGGQHCARPL